VTGVLTREDVVAQLADVADSPFDVSPAPSTSSCTAAGSPRTAPGACA
jgi:hypothetical protein